METKKKVLADEHSGTLSSMANTAAKYWSQVVVTDGFTGAPLQKATTDG